MQIIPLQWRNSRRLIQTIQVSRSPMKVTSQEQSTRYRDMRILFISWPIQYVLSEIAHVCVINWDVKARLTLLHKFGHVHADVT